MLNWDQAQGSILLWFMIIIKVSTIIRFFVRIFDPFVGGFRWLLLELFVRWVIYLFWWLIWALVWLQGTPHFLQVGSLNRHNSHDNNVGRLNFRLGEMWICYRCRWRNTSTIVTMLYTRRMKDRISEGLQFIHLARHSLPHIEDKKIFLLQISATSTLVGSISKLNGIEFYVTKKLEAQPVALEWWM